MFYTIILGVILAVLNKPLQNKQKTILKIKSKLIDTFQHYYKVALFL